MRHRYALFLTWLAATVVATSIGVFATYEVGGVIRGAGPLGRTVEVTTAPQAEDQEPESTSPARRTFTYPPATLTVECVGRLVTILDLTVETGWEVTEREDGPDEDVDVSLEKGDGELDVEVYCNEGIPRPVIEYEEPTDGQEGDDDDDDDDSDE